MVHMLDPTNSSLRVDVKLIGKGSRDFIEDIGLHRGS